MKLNWGFGIVLTLAGFIAFIMYFFIKGHFVQQVNLVTDDYYDQGLKHNERVEWKNNASSLAAMLEVEKVEGKVILHWPSTFDESTQGTVLFYRANNNKYDYQTTFTTHEGIQVVDGENLMRGNYTLKVRLTHEDLGYYWEQPFSF